MASNCCICGEKLSMMAGNFISDKVRICGVCYNHILKIRVSENSDMKAVNESRKYFEDYLSKGIDNEDTVKVLKAKLEESKEFERQACELRQKTLERKQAEQKRIEREIEWREERRERELYFKTTTGYNFEGYRIVEYKNIVNSEIVLGTGIFSELNAGVSDVLGTTASGYGGKLSTAKRTVLQLLIKNAVNIGANALIGIDFDIMTIGNNMIVVSANGTAVIIEQI